MLHRCRPTERPCWVEGVVPARVHNNIEVLGTSFPFQRQNCSARYRWRARALTLTEDAKGVGVAKVSVAPPVGRQEAYAQVVNAVIASDDGAIPCVMRVGLRVEGSA